MSQDHLDVRLEIRINASPKIVFTLLTDPVHIDDLACRVR
jgi:hypothetical protein